MNRTCLGSGLVIATALAASAFADMSALSSTNGITDQGFEGQGVSCTTVAISNLLFYIDRNQQGAGSLLADQDTPKSVQESVQQRYDPGLTGKWASGTEAKKATEQELTARGYAGKVKIFDRGRGELTYENLLKEWNDQELIILFMVDQENSTIGHSVMLWGMETNKDAAEKKLQVVDPNGHPNQNPTINGKPVKQDGAVHETGALTFTSSGGLAKWGISYSAPAFTYNLDEGTTMTYPAFKWDGYVLGFMSVSDVTKVPAPGAVVLAGSGLVLLGWARRRLTWHPRFHATQGGKMPGKKGD